MAQPRELGISGGDLDDQSYEFGSRSFDSGDQMPSYWTDEQIIEYLEGIDRPHSQIATMDGHFKLVVLASENPLTPGNPRDLVLSFKAGQSDVVLIPSRKSGQFIVVERISDEYKSPISQRYTNPNKYATDLETGRFKLHSNSPTAFIGKKYRLDYLSRVDGRLNIMISSTGPFQLAEGGFIDAEEYMRTGDPRRSMSLPNHGINLPKNHIVGFDAGGHFRPPIVGVWELPDNQPGF